MAIRMGSVPQTALMDLRTHLGRWRNWSDALVLETKFWGFDSPSAYVLQNTWETMKGNDLIYIEALCKTFQTHRKIFLESAVRYQETDLGA